MIINFGRFLHLDKAFFMLCIIHWWLNMYAIEYTGSVTDLSHPVWLVRQLYASSVTDVSHQVWLVRQLYASSVTDVSHQVWLVRQLWTGSVTDLSHQVWLVRQLCSALVRQLYNGLVTGRSRISRREIELALLVSSTYAGCTASLPCCTATL